MSSSQSLQSYLDVEERESKEIRPRNLVSLIKYILKHRGLLAMGILMLLVGTGATLLEPRLMGYAIDEAIIPRDWPRLRQLGILFFGAICLRVAAMVSQGLLFELLGQRVALDLRLKLFSHLLRLPVSVFDKNPAGRLLTRVTNDVSSLSEMFSSGFVSIVGNILIVIGILIWLLVANLKLGLIAASVFPVLVVATVYFSKRLKVAYRDARSKLSALNAFVAENLLGMKVVHLFNRQKLHLSRFDRINQWYADAQIASVRVYALFQPSITLAAGVSVALVIWFGGREVYHGNLQVGVLFAYFSYILSLFQPLREIADKWNVFLSGMASVERIFSVLNWPTELKEEVEKSREPLKREPIQGHIVFENVWFAYEGENWVLRDFSFEIRPGMRVGVIGHTGAGKTTLISLLMRFYDPQRGRILLDGKDLREYDKRALRALIGIIQQDVFLFSGSIKENITLWGQDSLTVAQAIEAMGYGHWLKGDSSVAKLQERGSNLSMGERQVLAFMRALAAEPQIWILDEATANMDSRTETMIQRSLDSAARGRTSILIAHRLATVRSADVILVLHKGALIEKGTHHELMTLNGLYARLYRYQQAEQVRAEQVKPDQTVTLS